MTVSKSEYQRSGGPRADDLNIPAGWGVDPRAMAGFIGENARPRRHPYAQLNAYEPCLQEDADTATHIAERLEVASRPAGPFNLPHSNQPLKPDDIVRELSILRKGLEEFDELRYAHGRRIEQLEKQVAELTAMYRKSDADEEEGEIVPPSPHSLWIERNMDELKRYPNCWIALDADLGIVIAEEDREKYAEKYKKLSPEQQDKLLLFHSSMYV